MVVQKMWGDITKLRELEHVELKEDAAGWIIAVRQFYDFALLGAAVLAAYLIVVEGTLAAGSSLAIWLLFSVDYGVRLWASDDRISYIRGHRIELLACLPLDFFRPLRLLRFVRPLGIMIRATAGLRDVLGLTGFTLIGSIGVVVVLLGGALLAWVEPETAPSVADGMWWSLVTTTTVGYGDISPTTTGGRLIAGALMVVGIGLLGAVTGEVAERMLSDRATDEVEPLALPKPSGNAQLDHVRSRLADWETLDSDERLRLARMLEMIADQSSATSRGPTGAQLET